MEEDDDHRQDGAQLDDHIEHTLELIADLQGDELVQQDQMPCGGDGQPLGDALYDAEQDGL